MLENMNFYKFMHKQILVLIALTIPTAFAYVLFAFIYDTNKLEILWYILVLVVSYWGYTLHKRYLEDNLTIEDKERWLNKTRYFFFTYFLIWSLMFVLYIFKENIELHYLAIFTQIGVATVGATLLVTEKKLALFIVLSAIFPITIYLVFVGELYSYIIALLTVVLAGVLLYSSTNTYSYLKRSKKQSYQDYLTNLGNRRYFIELLEDAIKSQKHDNNYMALLLVDLDYFKTINDTLGHDIGDMLLIEVSQRMSKLAKFNNVSLSRLGGDEFCILTRSYEDKQQCINMAKSFANDLLEVIKQMYVIEEHNLYISASIGISLIDKPDMVASTFIKEADIAMYEAKLSGRNGLIVFNEELSHRIERKLEIERLLPFALENMEITLKYQPQVDKDAKTVGCEVLMRWNNKELGFIGPDEFIPIAEHMGAIVELGYYVLEESFKTFKEWDKKGIVLDQLSINVSMRQMLHARFAEDVSKLCKRYLNEELSKKIIFEMTETSVAEDIDKLIETMNVIREYGIKFSMDDFGTGYSSLSYLRKIPLDELKIDKSFIFELSTNESDTAMVKTILNIAENLDLSVVAEGVETQTQKDFLVKENCDILQGYLFSKPIDKDEFEEYLKR